MATMNLKDKTQRQQLIERYLDANTSVEEEKSMADFFRHCDEKEFTDEELAIRNMMLGLGILAHKQESERTTQMEKPDSQSKWVRISAIMLAAAMLAGLIFLVFPIKDRMAQKTSLASMTPTTTVIRSQQTYDGTDELSPAEQMERQDSLFLATTKEFVIPHTAKRTSLYQSNPSVAKNSKFFASKEEEKPNHYEAERNAEAEAEKNAEAEAEKNAEAEAEKNAEAGCERNAEAGAERNATGEEFQQLFEVANLALPSAEQLKIDRQGDHIVISTTDDNGNMQHYTVDVDDAQDGIYQFHPLAQLNMIDKE